MAGIIYSRGDMIPVLVTALRIAVVSAYVVYSSLGGAMSRVFHLDVVFVITLAVYGLVVVTIFRYSRRGTHQMKGGYAAALGSVDMDEYYRCTTSLPPGAKCSVGEEEALPGGLVADAAGVLGTLGRKIYLLDTLRKDEYTDLLAESLERLQIDMGYVERLVGYRNLRTMIYLSEGEGTVPIHRNDKPPVTVNDEVRELLRNADFLYTTIYNLKELESYRELVGETKESYTGIMVDVEPTTFLNEENEEDDFLFRMTDIISFNEAPYKKYCKGSDVDFARKLAERNGSIVMVTMGERGRGICGDGKEYHIPTLRVKVAGTAKTGDTHNEAFLYGYLKGWGIKRVGTFTATATVWAVTGKGTQAGAVPERAVLEFLERLQRGGR